MTTRIKPPESLPEVYLPGPDGPLQPNSRRPKKRGLLWVVLLLIIAGVAGYAVWRAGHPVPAQKGQGGGGGGGGGGRTAPTGPVPVVVSKVSRSSIPVILNGLGNVAAF